MKKVLFLFAIAAMCTTACTKQSHGSDDFVKETSTTEDNPNGGGGDNTLTVPKAVLDAFKARYPKATKVQWKRLSNGNYKAEFYIGTVKWQAIFTPTGTLVKQEHD